MIMELPRELEQTHAVSASQPGMRWALILELIDFARRTIGADLAVAGEQDQMRRLPWRAAAPPGDEAAIARLA